MADDLPTLLQNNAASSDATISQVKEFLIQPLKEFAETQMEIQRLEELLKASKKKLADIQNIITTYSAVLSPIRRLGDDILREIFYNCLPFHRNSVMSASEAPILLTRICRSWRSIAFSSPRIWTRLHIPLTTLDIDDDAFSDEQGSVVYIPHPRVKVVQEWLSRSGVCPLSISITFPDYLLHGRLDQDRSQEAILQAIVPYAHRWRDVELTMPWEIYQVLEAKLSIDMLSSVYSFRSDLHVRRHTVAGDSPIFLLSPNLTKLSLSSNMRRPNTWNVNTPTTTWNRLTYLSLHYPVPDVDAFALLSQCPNLIYCKLLVGTDPDDDDGILRLQRIQYGTVNLTHLRSFGITDGGTIKVMTRLFERVDVPSLTHLEYQSTGAHPPISPAGNQPTQGLPVLSLLRRTPFITKLQLDPTHISHEDIVNFIKLASSVTHLVLGEVSITPQPRATPLFTYTDTFDLGQLINGNFDDLATSAILPALESLEVYDLWSFSDEELLYMIKMRIDLWEDGRLNTPLKRIKIQFQREAQFKIDDEAVEYSQAAGIQLHLNLSYTAAPPKNLDFESSSYGLTFDGRSWSLPDIEENAPPITFGTGR